jgi:sensor domain CHASE-containing protein
MKRKQETLLVSSIGLLVIILILMFSAKFIVLKGFTALETDDTREHLQWLVNTVDNELDALGSWAGDYATWDDSYRFIQDGNPEFAAINLSTESLSKLRINLVAMVRSSGEIVFASALDHTTRKNLPVPPDLARHLTTTSPLLQFSTRESTVKGILTLSSGPYLVVAKPILTSKGLGPSQGALIMARAIDPNEISRLARLTNISLAAIPVDTASFAKPPFSASRPLSLANPLRVKPLDDDIINGYALFGDLYQRPALLIKATFPRHIYTKGVKTIRYFLVWCGLISAASLVTINWALHKYASSQRHEDTEQLFAAALAQTTTSVLLLDADTGRIEQVNAAVSLLLGFTPEQLDGTLIKELLADGGTWAAFDQCREATIRDRSRNCCTLQLRCHDQQAIGVIAVASAVVLNNRHYLCLELQPEPKTSA